MASQPQLSVLHLSTAKSWRGGENQLLLLSEGLSKRGHTVLILAPQNAPLHERAKALEIPTQILTLRSEVDPMGVYRLARLLREIKPDILHLHDAHGVLPGQLASRTQPKGALAVIAHRRTAFRIRSKWKYNNSVSRIIAISEAARQQVLSVGIESGKVATVFSGLLFKKSDEQTQQKGKDLREKLGLSATSILIAHAAALTSEKRQKDMILALGAWINKSSTLVKASGNHDIHLAIAGKGPLELELKQQVERANLTKNIHFLGFLQKMEPLWEAADLTIFSSEQEGLCTALIEAQGAGLPAIITRAGGMPEVVQEDKTGLIVPVGDVDALSDAIEKLASDSSLRQRMSKAASRRMHSVFSAESMIEGTLRVYLEAQAMERKKQ